MTLADLNFTYDISGLDDLKSKIANSLQISNYIEETPSIIINDLQDIVDYFSNNFTTNLENFTKNIKDYFDQQVLNLKNDIEQSLALDPNIIYDIHVTEADHAINADKLEGKTFNEIVSYIVTTYITPATVANALKFDGKTYSEILNDIQQKVKVNNAVNADKLNNMTYDDIKNDIISSIDLGNGVDLDLIQDKVENEWVAYKSKDTEAFGGDDKDTWINNIIPLIKVNNAVEADRLNGYTFNDIITSVNTIIENQLNNYIATDDFINSIKNIKVLSAFNADEAINSLRLNNYTFNDLMDYIADNVTISEALNSENFANLSKEDWEAYIQTQIQLFKNDLTTGNFIPAVSQEVLQINGIQVSEYDDHIREIVNDIFNDLTGEINATYLNGYNFNDLIAYIQQQVKVDNAANADKADIANIADYAYNSKRLNNKTDIDIENEALNLVLNHYIDNPVQVVDINIQNKNYFEYNSSLFYLFNYLNPTNQSVILDISSLNYGFKKQTFTYDDNGNITEIKYYTSDDLIVFEDTNEAVYSQAYINQHELYTYDDNGNIITIEKNIYIPINYDENNPYTKITYKQSLSYDENGNVIEINNDNPVIQGVSELITN